MFAVGDDRLESVFFAIVLDQEVPPVALLVISQIPDGGADNSIWFRALVAGSVR